MVKKNLTKKVLKPLSFWKIWKKVFFEKQGLLVKPDCSDNPINSEIFLWVS
jgi:hypothetical protein